MRHKVSSRTLGRKKSHRLSMLKNLACDLFKYRRIETTQARAKEVTKLAEKLISFAKEGDLNSKRKVFSYISNREVAKELFDTIAPKYKEGTTLRKSGYVRMVKMGQRRGDGAPVVILELV